MDIGCDSCTVEMSGLHRKGSELKYSVSMVPNKLGH